MRLTVLLSRNTLLPVPLVLPPFCASRCLLTSSGVSLEGDRISQTDTVCAPRCSVISTTEPGGPSISCVSLATVSPASGTPSIIAITSPGFINPDLHHGRQSKFARRAQQDDLLESLHTCAPNDPRA